MFARFRSLALDIDAALSAHCFDTHNDPSGDYVDVNILNRLVNKVSVNAVPGVPTTLHGTFDTELI